MKKYFLSLALFLYAWSVQAHQTEISSTMLVEQDNNTWVLQIRSALTAFDQAIQANYPEYESAEEFQALVLDHIKKNLQITFNEKDEVTLQNGMVKLGHESSVVFDISHQLSNITTPIGIYWGWFDAIHPPVMAEDFYAKIGSTQKELFFFRNSFHSPMANENEAFQEKVIEFIHQHK